MFILFLFPVLLFTYYVLLATPTTAQCPVCIVTVGGGMLLARKLGIDDFLVSIWISALNTAIAFYLAPKIKFKLLNNPLILSFLLYLTTMIYFATTNQMWHLNNRLLGIDKILFGQTLGLIVMILGNMVYLATKRRNGGKALFPYSKVVFPVGAVLLVTIIFKLAFKL